MNLADLGVLYGMAGALGGVVVYRSQPQRDARALGAALLSAPLWPLWLPVLFASQRAERDLQRTGASETEAALLEGHEAVRNTPLEPLLPRAAVDRMLRELRRATERHAELSNLLSKKGFDSGAAEERIARLQSLAARDRRALEELSELVAALRTQLVFARYSGSSPGEASDIVTEVWARVEMLGTSSDGAPFDLEAAPLAEENALGQARPDSG